MVEPTVTDCSKEIVQVLLDAAQDILGAEQLMKVLNDLSVSPLSADTETAYVQSLSFLDLCGLPQILEGIYGIPGGRGLSLRIGRSVFRYGLHNLGELAGLRDMEFRLLPAPRRIYTGLQALAKLISREAGSPIAVTDEGTCWTWRAENCPLCRGHLSADPCCYLMVGLLQEFLSWAGGGRYYQVTETSCCAIGASACVYSIEKKPLD